MKKVLTSFALCLVTLLAQAQVEKGNVVLMGGAGYNSNTSTSEFTGSPSIENKNNAFDLDIGVAYFLAANFAVSLAVLTATTNTLVNGNQNTSSFLMGARIAGRYYMPCMAPRFYTYGQLWASTLGGNQRNYDPSNGDELSRDNLTEFGVGINPGFAYFLTPAIALEMSFGLIGWQQSLRVDNANNDNRVTNNELQFLLNSKALTIGFCWWLGRGGQSF